MMSINTVIAHACALILVQTTSTLVQDHMTAGAYARCTHLSSKVSGAVLLQSNRTKQLPICTKEAAVLSHAFCAGGARGRGHATPMVALQLLGPFSVRCAGGVLFHR